MPSRDQVTLGVEVIVDSGVNRENEVASEIRTVG